MFLPDDIDDRRHLANVRPEGDANPAPKRRDDMVVVGAGPGGLVTAAAAAAIGARR
jgi:threonine dehydrogenase-like Zn-dependent dehydrogenase